MAWSFTDLDSDYQTWLGKDYPILLAQVIPREPLYSKWVEEAQIVAGSIATWTDRSATANPALRAYDRLPGPLTKQSGTNDDVWYYALDLNTTYSFSWAGIINHNLGTLDLGNDVLLQIADDNDFSTSLTTVGNFGTPTANDDTRLSDISLAHDADGGRAHDTGADAGPNVYTAQYVWLKIDKTGTNITPQIGELILGTRYQMRCNPQNPYDEDRLHDGATSIVTGSVTHKQYQYQNQFILDALFEAWETARIADFKSWFKQARGSFIWIPKPNSAPDNWYIISKQDDLAMPAAEFTERSVRITGAEQGPEATFLENE